MAAESKQVVTTLTIDARGASAGSAEYARAMQAAQAAADRTIDTSRKAQQAIEKQTTVMTGGAASVQGLARQWDRLAGSVDPAIKAEQRHQAALVLANRAVTQLGVSQTEAMRIANLAGEAAKKNTAANDNLARSMSFLQGQMDGFAGRAGTVGQALGVLGPVGIAVAASLGLAAIAMHELVTRSNELSDKADKMVNFAETTGLSTTALQALNKAAAEVGISSEMVGSSVERFTVQMEKLRRGSGDLFDGLNRIAPELTDQLALTRNVAEAWDVLAKAYKRAGDQETRNALARATFGRTGIGFGRVLGVSDAAGGLQPLMDGMNKVDLLQKEQLKHWAELQSKINAASKAAQDNIASIFATDVLHAELRFYETFLGLSRDAKEFKTGPGWDIFVAGLKGLPIIGALANLIPGRSRGEAEGPPMPAGDSFSDRFGGFGSGRGVTKPEFDVAREKQRIAILGEAATATEKLKLKIAELKIAAGEMVGGDEALRRATAALNEEFKVNRMSDAVSALGSAATVTEQYDLKVAQLTQKLHQGAISQQTFNRSVAGLKDDFALDRLRDGIAAIGELATETDRYNLRVAELSQQLKQGRISQDQFNKGLIAADPIFKQLKDSADTFFQSMVSNLSQGKSGADALAGSLQAVGQQLSANLAKKATEDLIAGTLSMDPATLAKGGAEAIAAITIGALQGDATKRKQREKDFEDAQKAWADLSVQVGDFTRELRGQGRTGLGGALEDARRKAQDFANAAHKAGEGHADLQKALDEFAQRKAKEFIASFDVMVEAMDMGLGSNSPAVKGAEHIREIGSALKAFIDDTYLIAGNSAAYDKAVGSARAYAVTLLSEEETLSKVQERLLQLRGASEQLYGTLQDLGMSATDAAAAINMGLTKELDKLRSDFAKDVSAKLNDALGQGYLNDLDALISESVGLFRDAQSLGADPTLIGRYFAVQAQKIVDGAGLVGDSFNELIHVFPELAGVVVESTDAMAQQINELGRTIRQFLTDLRTGPSSPLSPQGRLAAAQGAFSKDLTAAQGGDVAAMGNITKSASTLIEAARGFYASSGPFQAIFNQVTSALETLSAPKVTDPVVEQLQAANSSLQSIKLLQDLTAGISSSIDVSSRNIGQQAEDLATWQGSNYFGPMKDYLAQIATNTLLTGAPAAPPEKSFEWWNPFTWFNEGGIVGRYAPGGIVGNGIWNQDSVRARFAGGGDVMLAGGEGVLTAPAARAIGGGPTVDFINRNRTLPSSGANDNGALVSELRALRAEVAALRAEQRMGLAQTAQSSMDGADMVAGAVSQAGRSQAREMRAAEGKKAAKRAAG